MCRTPLLRPLLSWRLHALRRSLRRSLPIALLCSSTMAATMPAPPPGAEANLERMTLALSREKPYRFRLHYRGPTMPFRGPLCYGFAGYNETCFELELDWLTPATTIDLHAPGGVPRDLLAGYMMLVRYPAMAERTYRYALDHDVPAPTP